MWPHSYRASLHPRSGTPACDRRSPPRSGPKPVAALKRNAFGFADRMSAFQAARALFLRRRYAFSLRFAQRCRSEDRRSLPAVLPFLSGGPFGGAVAMVEAAGIEPASESLLQRRLHAYPGCGGNPRPGAPFPLSVPRRINPANRGSVPIPGAHRRLGKTAGKARLGRRPFPPGRRGQEGRGYLSSQCQFSVGFCFVSTVYERWTPDMQSLLHVPSSNPVRPLLARFGRHSRG